MAAIHWPTKVNEAVAVQQQLRQRVRLEDDLGTPATIAGIDTAFPERTVARGAVVVLSYPDLQPLEQAVAHVPVTFPYVPGLLSFREGPAILEALSRLSSLPDLLLFDGHGYAHPRRVGIASHLGVLLDRPAIGCAKSILTGSASEPGYEPGDHTRLLSPDGELLGYALRTKRRTRPVYVSPGHRVSFETAVAVVMACVRGYRLPEPTRLADRLSKSADAAA